MNEFDPVIYSHEENRFLLAHLGEPTVVAMRVIPPDVNPVAIRPVLDRVNELEQLKTHEGQEWVGIPAIKQAIATYLATDAKWESDAKRSKRAPRFPSLYSFDSRGRGHIGGPGSDSGRVRTYFGPDGQRLPFAISLQSDVVDDWVAPTMEQPIAVGLTENVEAHRIECFCGHTESYKEGSRASHNAARARMSKHLRKATDEVERHREIHTNEFQS